MRVSSWTPPPHVLEHVPEVRKLPQVQSVGAGGHVAVLQATTLGGGRKRKDVKSNKPGIVGNTFANLIGRFGGRGAGSAAVGAGALVGDGLGAAAARLGARCRRLFDPVAGDVDGVVNDATALRRAQHAAAVGGAQAVLAAGDTRRVHGRVDARAVLLQANVRRREIGAAHRLKARVAGPAAQRVREALAVERTGPHALLAGDGAARVANRVAAKPLVDLRAHAFVTHAVRALHVRRLVARRPVWQVLPQPTLTTTIN